MASIPPKLNKISNVEQLFNSILYSFDCDDKNKIRGFSIFLYGQIRISYCKTISKIHWHGPSYNLDGIVGVLWNFLYPSCPEDVCSIPPF